MASSLCRLSWQSIETFEHGNSDMESLVATVRYREERKKRVLSLLFTATMLLGLCYIVGSFFSFEDLDDEDSEDSIPMSEAMIPKFLHPLFHAEEEVSGGFP